MCTTERCCGWRSLPPSSSASCTPGGCGPSPSSEETLPTLHPGRRGLGCRRGATGAWHSHSFTHSTRGFFPCSSRVSPSPCSSHSLPLPSHHLLALSPLLSLPALACVPPGTFSEPLLRARHGSTRPDEGMGCKDPTHTHTHTHTHTRTLKHHSQNTAAVSLTY